ncbi:Hypothetical protein FKW44_007266 [Caligus rogercresseyi]|uniref:Uncharacterized protein n=1 Tax=Caligus rogercresseyi TaxID=217165 RepID=A0A7T8KEH6_CALRO|nr:Hypothetical protein FKW44_007266 [Caligus rogercresseyi]
MDEPKTEISKEAAYGFNLRFLRRFWSLQPLIFGDRVNIVWLGSYFSSALWSNCSSIRSG